MGYLVACFYFLLVGGNLLLKPVKSILVYWDFLIGYNVFVITMKNILSVRCIIIIIIILTLSESNRLNVSTCLSVWSDPGLWFHQVVGVKPLLADSALQSGLHHQRVHQT